jgi:hypothetical protein
MIGARGRECHQGVVSGMTLGPFCDIFKLNPRILNSWILELEASKTMAREYVIHREGIKSTWKQWTIKSFFEDYRVTFCNADCLNPEPTCVYHWQLTDAINARIFLNTTIDLGNVTFTQDEY